MSGLVYECHSSSLYSSSRIITRPERINSQASEIAGKRRKSSNALSDIVLISRIQYHELKRRSRFAKLSFAFAQNISLNRHLLHRVLIRAEAQQRSHVSGLFHVGITVNKTNLSSVAQSQIHQGVGNVTQFTRSMPADGTGFNHAGIQMAAVRAFYGFRFEAAQHQKSLYFLAFQSVQHVFQTDSAARVTMRFAHHLAYKFHLPAQH